MITYLTLIIALGIGVIALQVSAILHIRNHDITKRCAGCYKFKPHVKVKEYKIGHIVVLLCNSCKKKYEACFGAKYREEK